MRVVVTGGTGLIGTALVRSLGNDGHEVYILSRNPKQKGPMPETIHYVTWDAKTTAGWGQLVDGADAVINLAGASIGGEGFLPPRWTPERKQLILQSRLDATNAVVQAIREAGQRPEVLIQASAVGYYGTHPNSETLTEDSAVGDDFLADVCKQWEAASDPVLEMGVRRCVIRTGVVLDNEEGALTRIVLPFKLFAGGPLGSGKQPFPWIHLDDEVNAIRFLIDHDEVSGVFNLTAPEVVTNKEFARVTGKVLGRPSFVPAPEFAFRLAFGEVATLVVDGQRAVPAALQAAGYTFKFPGPEAAMRDLYG